MTFPVWKQRQVGKGTMKAVLRAALHYDPKVETNWGGKAWVTARTATTVTVEFDTPAPDDGMITLFGQAG